MITEQNFRKVEAMLYRHYSQKRQLERMQHTVGVLEIKIKEAVTDIRETNISLGDGISGIDYSRERVSGGLFCNGGPQESELVQAISKIEKEICCLVKKKLKIKAKIRELEVQQVQMDRMLSLLTQECKDIVELKYSQSKSYTAMGLELNLSENTVRNRRKEIVYCIAKYLNIR